MAKATLTDGTVIKFPDGLPPEKVKAIISKANAAHGGKPVPSPEPEPQVDPAVLPIPTVSPQTRGTLEDIAVGAITGINKGVAAIPGIPGSIQQLAKAGDAYLKDTAVGRFMGIDKAPQFPQLPTAEDTIAGFEQLTGELPEPETRAGQYAEAVGQFVPGGGGARALTKLGSAALLGGASEGGADLGRTVAGPTGEAVGRAAGTAAGLLGSRGRRPNILKEAKKIEGVPATAKAAKALANEAYDVVKKDPTEFNPSTFNRALLEAANKVTKEGHTRQNTPALNKFLKDHMVPIKPGKLDLPPKPTRPYEDAFYSKKSLSTEKATATPPTYASGKRAIEMETARQKANKMSQSKDVGKARVGVNMREAIDKHIGKEVLPNKPEVASGIMEGRLNYRSRMLGKEIEKRIKAGEGAEDVMSSLRTRFRNYGASNADNIPEELAQGIDEFLRKPPLRRGIKAVGSTARLMGPLLGFGTGGVKGLLLGGAAKAAGHGIKKLQEMGDLSRAEMVKKIALMQPHQRAQLAKALARSKSKRRLLGENVILGVGAQEK